MHFSRVSSRSCGTIVSIPGGAGALTSSGVDPARAEQMCKECRRRRSADLSVRSGSSGKNRVRQSHRPGVAVYQRTSQAVDNGNWLQEPSADPADRADNIADKTAELLLVSIRELSAFFRGIRGRVLWDACKTKTRRRGTVLRASASQRHSLAITAQSEAVDPSRGTERHRSSTSAPALP